jgi:hypothetical protein
MRVQASRILTGLCVLVLLCGCARVHHSSSDGDAKKPTPLLKDSAPKPINTPNRDRRAFIEEDSWYTSDLEKVSLDGRIPRECIFPIPEQARETTIGMLSTTCVVSLSIQQVKELLSIEDLDMNAPLEKAAQEADSKAEFRERSAEDPDRADRSESNKKSAQEFRQMAAKYRNMKDKLKPYLVRGLVLQEATGGFSVFQEGSTLWVSHGCLGGGPTSMKRRPIIILLEQEPKVVYLSVSMAE